MRIKADRDATFARLCAAEADEMSSTDKNVNLTMALQETSEDLTSEDCECLKMVCLV